MMTFIRKFRKSEDGAVTVDWVILTGGLLILGIVIAAYVTNGSTTMAGGTGNALSVATVPSIVF